MDERKSKRTVAVDRDSVHVSSPPRIYRRFYDGCRIPSVRYHVLPSPFTRPFLLMENVASKNEPATSVHVGREKRENCISLAWRGVMWPNTKKWGCCTGDERSSLSERLCRCGNDHPPSLRNGEKKLDRFYARQCLY